MTTTGVTRPLPAVPRSRGTRAGSAAAARQAPCAPTHSDRRLRLGRRRPDRSPARVPRVAAARGLRLPGGHRAVPVRRPVGRTSCASSRSSWPALLLADGAKLLVVACNSATAAALPALREELAGRVPVVGVVAAGVAAGGVGHAQRAGRAAGHAGHRRQRRLCASAGRGRARRRAARRRLGRARAADPDRHGGRPGRRRLRRGRLRTAQGGGRRHGHPRLHPLPAGAAGAPALPRPRGGDRQLGPGDRRRGRARPRRRRAGGRPGAQGRATASSRAAGPTTSAARASASSSSRSTRCDTSRSPSRAQRSAA